MLISGRPREIREAALRRLPRGGTPEVNPAINDDDAPADDARIVAPDEITIRLAYAMPRLYGSGYTRSPLPICERTPLCHREGLGLRFASRDNSVNCRSASGILDAACDLLRAAARDRPRFASLSLSSPRVCHIRAFFFFFFFSDDRPAVKRRQDFIDRASV